MSTDPSFRTTRRPERRVLAGTALGTLMLVGGAGIGCAGGHSLAPPQRTVTKPVATKNQATHASPANGSSRKAEGGGADSAPTSNPAPANHGSGTVAGQGAPRGAGQSGAVPQGTTGSGGDVAPFGNSGDASGSGGYDPSTYGGVPPASGSYDPSTYGGGYTSPTDNGATADTTPDTSPDTTPQPNMDAYHAYDQQSWDAWKASSDAANAGDPATAYQLNQDSLNATANANDAYSGTLGTPDATGNGEAPSGE